MQRMSSRPYAATEAPRLNVTPLIGIVLVLLAVFMASAPATTHVDLNMPPDSLGGRNPVLVSVTPGGAIYVGPDKSSLATLEADVGNAVRLNKARSVLVRGDKTIAYADFYRVLSRLKNDGYRVGMVNEDME